MNAKEVPKPGTLDHIAVDVQGLEEALRFYTGVLGLKEKGTPGNLKAQGIVWLEWADGTVLHLVQSEAKSPPILAHLAICVEDADAWRDHITAMGVEVESPKVQIYNAKRHFVRDPSGNRIEFVQWLER